MATGRLMSPHYDAPSARWLWVVMALVAMATGAAGPGCGRGRTGNHSDVSELYIARYRFNIDETQDIARIVAEICNPTDQPVKEAVVTAILLARGGEQRGENKAIIRDLRANDTTVFSMTVTTHGRERDVQFRISPPGDAQQES